MSLCKERIVAEDDPLGACNIIVQELCESRGGRLGLSVLTSLLVSVDVNTPSIAFRHPPPDCQNWLCH